MPRGDNQPVDVAGAVRPFTTPGWPTGYVYGATRYADVILAQSFPARYRDLTRALEGFHPTLDELRVGGGGRTVFVKRFDESLAAMTEDEISIWGKRNVRISKSVELEGLSLRNSVVRGHEIDMFGQGSLSEPLPGIAVEMEWNNKDPFYDRDLVSFQALHREGAIAIGVIVTRGPTLQSLIGPIIKSKQGNLKYGQSTTHWDKLIPRVNLGGGGECPLLLVGIEPNRITGIDLVYQVRAMLDDAAQLKRSWRTTHRRWKDARPEYVRLRAEAVRLLPPLGDSDDDTDDGS